VVPGGGRGAGIRPGWRWPEASAPDPRAASPGSGGLCRRRLARPRIRRPGRPAAQPSQIGQLVRPVLLPLRAPR